VEATYGVTVEKVRTLNYGPERRSRYTKNGIQHSKTNATKRAVVEVAAKEKILIFIVIYKIGYVS
jgi:large subunit ribosomal protein L23